MRRRPALLLMLVTAATVATGCTSGSAPAPTAPSPVPPTTTVTTPAPSVTPTTPLVTVTPAVNDTTVVTEPLEGAVVTGPSVTVSGEATAFEGTLAWLVYPVGGSAAEPVQEGTTTTGANGTVAPFEVVVDLDPGAWVVQVFEESPKDGTPLRPVAVTFTVV